MKSLRLKTLIILSIVIILMLLGYFFFLYFSFDSWEERASFGSMFGAISTLFAGLSLAGIIYTINIQRQEIRNDRVVFNEKKKEQDRLNFENKFFLLFHDLTKSTDRLKIEYNNNLYENHLFFKGAYFSFLYMPGIDWKKEMEISNYKTQLKSVYNSFIHKVQNEYSIFTSKLFFLLKYLDKETTISFDEKLFYSKVINCELNSYAMVMLIYHAIYKEDTIPEWFEFLKKYNVLDKLNENYLVNKKNDMEIWNKKTMHNRVDG